MLGGGASFTETGLSPQHSYMTSICMFLNVAKIKHFFPAIHQSKSQNTWEDALVEGGPESFATTPAPLHLLMREGEPWALPDGGELNRSVPAASVHTLAGLLRASTSYSALPEATLASASAEGRREGENHAR